MRRLLGGVRPSMLAVAIVAALALTGTAAANRMIRDNTINTRDIKNNQVNTRDLRDGAIRGVDVHDGSLGAADLAPQVTAQLGTAALLDPRARNLDDDLAWNLGPRLIGQVASSPSDPIPNTAGGEGWRDAVLDPGTYVIQTTAYAAAGGTGTEGVATRLFLGGAPVGVGGGYNLSPVSAGGLPEARTTATAIQVPQGTPAQRQLIERVISLGAPAQFSDDFLIWKVSPS